MPVGAGKTNASLRYALHHARTFYDRRIIYATAFLSVLEQNAKDIQDIIGKEHVLEHHSSVVADDCAGEEEEYEGAEYLRESWESPVILTTLVTAQQYAVQRAVGVLEAVFQADTLRHHHR